MRKLMFFSVRVMCVLCISGMWSFAIAQDKTIKVSGNLKGLDAVQLLLLGADDSRMPIELGSTVVDKGKFHMTFKADPKQADRFCIYIPSLDKDHRNKDSRREFFADNVDIYITGKVKGDGFTEFDVPNSTVYQQYQAAKAKVDYEPWKKQGIVSQQCLEDLTNFKVEWEQVHQMGDQMSVADSATLKSKEALLRKADEKYFELEYGLGLQVLEQIKEGQPNRGLNALAADHFRGCSEDAMEPLIKKYTDCFGVDYIKQDFYLGKLYYDYRRMTMYKKDSEILDFSFVDLKGKEGHFSDFKGKYIYANYWDLEDPDHQLQIDALEELAENYKGNKNIVFVNVSMNRDPQLWKSRMIDHKLNVTQWSVKDGNDVVFYKAYRVRELPRAVLISSDQKIVEFFMKVPTDPAVKQVLDSLLH